MISFDTALAQGNNQVGNSESAGGSGQGAGVAGQAAGGGQDGDSDSGRPDDKGGRPEGVGGVDLFGDMYVILRDDQGVPILSDAGFVQPLAEDGSLIPLDEK